MLDEAINRLISVFQPERIYLFGSQARGDATSDSDFDLLLVVPSSSEPRYRRMMKAQAALWGIWVAMDVLVLTHDEFEREKGVVCSLSATVLREGKQLYAA